MEPEPSLEIRKVQIGRVAPHPANPRTDLGDIDRLAASIGVQGVLIPLVVLPADRVAALWHEHAAALAGSEWVVLSGHRRLAAARRALGDDAPVPVEVRTDAICDDRLAQLAFMRTDNIARSPLTPMEEARAFRSVGESGLSQRRIARESGCTQSHVSRRLALLRLPDELHPHIDSGRLPIRDGLRLAALDGHEAMLGVWRLLDDTGPDLWIDNVELAIEEYQRRSSFQRRRRVSLAQAEAAGITIVDAVSRFGKDLPAHRITSEAEIAAARERGTLVADVDSDGCLEYYSTAARPRPAEKTPRERQAARQDRPEQAAARARERAALILVAHPPQFDEAAADIVSAWLLSAGPEARRLARRWLVSLHIGPKGETPAGGWWSRVHRGPWTVRVHAAHALALARREVDARIHEVWSADDIDWLRRLIDQAGYTPTDWERRRLGGASDGARG